MTETEQTSYMPDDPVILHIANLTSDKSKGPNNNVPKNIIHGIKCAKMGLFNLEKAEIAFSLPKGTYFSSKDHNSVFDLPTPFDRPQVVIFQGMYKIDQCMIARQLVKKGIPYIVVPRCSLTSAAQNSKRLKKRIGNILFFNSFIANAKKSSF